MEGRGSAGRGVYHIRVRGHLSDRWAGWFGGLAIENQPNGDALLFGPLPDQAALHGVLNQLRDVGVPLLSVNCIDAEQDGTVAPLPGGQSSPEVDRR